MAIPAWVVRYLPTIASLVAKLVEKWASHKGTRPRPPVIGALLFVLATASPAAAIDFAWDANTEPDLAGYRLYRSPASAGASGPVCANAWDVVAQYVLVTAGSDNPSNGRWCYSLTAIDTKWPLPNESGRSNVVFLQVPYDSTPPAVPTNLRLVP